MRIALAADRAGIGKSASSAAVVAHDPSMATLTVQKSLSTRESPATRVGHGSPQSTDDGWFDPHERQTLRACLSPTSSWILRRPVSRHATSWPTVESFVSAVSGSRPLALVTPTHHELLGTGRSRRTTGVTTGPSRRDTDYGRRLTSDAKVRRLPSSNNGEKPRVRGARP